MKPPKQKSMFDDLDDLYKSIQSDIATIDAIKPEVKYLGKPAAGVDLTRRDPQRPNLPDHRDPNFHWDRDKIQLMINVATVPESYTMDHFITWLVLAAPFFVWNDFRDDKPIRGWSKLGYTFDPVTAVVLYRKLLHFSISVSDLGALMLGLSPTDAKQLAFICWHNNLQDRPENILRTEVINAIKRGQLSEIYH